jgi:hypothetical protein
MSVAQAADKLAALAEVGVDDVIIGMANPEDGAVYELVADLGRQVAPLEAARP